MYTLVYTKVQINDDTHDEVMTDIGVKQGCPPLSHTRVEAPITDHLRDYALYLEKHKAVQIFLV